MPNQNATPAAHDAAWRTFPQFEKSFGTGDPENTYRRIEQTCRQLDKLIHSGSELEQSRAKSAMNAYARLLELVRMVTDQQTRQPQQG